MKKILSIILSLAMFTTMLGAFGLTASAAVTVFNGTSGSALGSFKNAINIDNETDLKNVYQAWTTTTDYDNSDLIYVNDTITLTQSYDFTKEGHEMSLSFSGGVVIQKDVTLKAKTVLISGNDSKNYGTIILTRSAPSEGALYVKVDSYSNGFTNYGTIKLLNDDKIICYSDQAGQYGLRNDGTIETVSGNVSFSTSYSANANGDVYINPASVGTVQKLPTVDISSPIDTGDSNLSMSGVAIPAPTYTVTIPKTIDFGDCDKAMKNDTAENKIKTIDVSGLSITHSNLFANEKKVTVTMSSDFTIKDGDNALNFELYDGENKLVTNKVLITANPTQADDGVSDTKPLTAKLDKTQIKKSGTYQGTVTFTVAMSDNA